MVLVQSALEELGEREFVGGLHPLHTTCQCVSSTVHYLCVHGGEDVVSPIHPKIVESVALVLCRSSLISLAKTAETLFALW